MPTSSPILSEFDQKKVAASFRRTLRKLAKELQHKPDMTGRNEYTYWKIIKEQKELRALLRQEQFFSEENYQLLQKYDLFIDRVLMRQPDSSWQREKICLKTAPALLSCAA